jgi:hypothetical protein
MTKTRKPLRFAKPNHIEEAARVGLSAYHLDRLIQVDAARSKEVRENPVVYPKREDVPDLSTTEVVKLGFVGRGATAEEAEELFFRRHRRGRNRRNKGNQNNRGGQKDDNRGGSGDKGRTDSGSSSKPQGKGQSKGQSKGGNKGGNSGGGKRLPDPLVAHKIFADVLGAHLKPVDGTGNVKIIEWNAEFLNADKVAYFKELYTNVATYADFIAVEEATHDGLRAWAEATGYVALCSEENSRGQAVGALVNPKRLKIRKTAVYNSLKVMGINDLRPGFHIYLTDVVTGLNFAPIVLHLKSMRGGEVTSGKVRQLQCEKLIEAIGVGKFGGKPALGNMKVFPFFRNTVLGRDVSDHAIVYWELQTSALTKEEVTTANEDELDIPMGDMNSKLDTATDVTGTLEAANYLLVNKNSKVGTQSMGPSRLDGAFRNQPNDTAIGGGNGGDPHGPFSDDPSEAGVEINVN